jgi:hypothetical protein
MQPRSIGIDGSLNRNPQRPSGIRQPENWYESVTAEGVHGRKDHVTRGPQYPPPEEGTAKSWVEILAWWLGHVGSMVPGWCASTQPMGKPVGAMPRSTPLLTFTIVSPVAEPQRPGLPHDAELFATQHGQAVAHGPPPSQVTSPHWVVVTGPPLPASETGAWPPAPPLPVPEAPPAARPPLPASTLPGRDTGASILASPPCLLVPVVVELHPVTRRTAARTAGR